jgi:Rieske Fe-S protein
MSEANSEPEPNTPSGAATTRRAVLRTAGLMALAGSTAAAAACAPNSQTGAAPTATESGEPTPSAPSSSAAPTPSASSPPATNSSAAPRQSASKAPSGPSVATSEVPVGGGVILNNANYVVTQPSKGAFKAFTSTCTHMGCTVAEVANGVIHCNCHGSEFSIKDGSVVNPPAARPLAQHKVTVASGKVVVTD